MFLSFGLSVLYSSKEELRASACEFWCAILSSKNEVILIHVLLTSCRILLMQYNDHMVDWQICFPIQDPRTLSYNFYVMSYFIRLMQCLLKFIGFRATLTLKKLLWHMGFYLSFHPPQSQTILVRLFSYFPLEIEHVWLFSCICEFTVSYTRT